MKSHNESYLASVSFRALGIATLTYYILLAMNFTKNNLAAKAADSTPTLRID